MASVALRKESVDRNTLSTTARQPPEVALRKESVDRNISLNSITYADPRRSPQGERG